MSAVDAGQIFSKKCRQAVLNKFRHFPGRHTWRATHVQSSLISGICEYERRHKRCPNQD